MNTFQEWEIKKTFFRRNAKTIFLEAKPFEGYEIINEVGMENNILIVTDQFKGLEHLTLKWLNMWDIRYKDIFFTGNKETVRGDILLDDSPRNLLNILDSSIKIIMDRPYNQKIGGIRVNDLEEFSNLIYNFFN